jgi:hypothetical protein
VGTLHAGHIARCSFPLGGCGLPLAAGDECVALAVSIWADGVQGETLKTRWERYCLRKPSHALATL